MRRGLAEMEADLLIIRAGRGEGRYWLDLVHYRELFWTLARRDVAVRYRQTTFGVAWALLRPLLTMLVFTMIFGRLANLPSAGAPYALLVFSGMLPWFFFASAVSDSSNSLVVNGNLLSKIYFPRILVPASAVVVAGVDFVVSLVLMILLMLYFDVTPTWRLLFLPLFFVTAVIAAMGIGLWLSALNVRYRDIQFAIPFVVQFGLFVSPVGFSSAVVPDSWLLVYAMNPMVGVIDGFRWALLGEGFPLRWQVLALSLSVSMLCLASGVAFFRSIERSFADII